MRRALGLLVVAALVAAACGRAARPGEGGASADQRLLGIYEAAFRALAGTEGWFDPILLDERICGRAGDPMVETDQPCEGRFAEEEQAALLEALADLDEVRFVADAEAAMRAIFEGRLEGAGLLTVGPIEGEGDRVEVAGRAYCGGLCAHWMTWVIERTPEGWEVSGTTGPVAIS